uniref:KEN domain-containing protein n=1 Tax=Haemonchus placei TaxID=6290 RepID=A0A0N4WN67_HAEPC
LSLSDLLGSLRGKNLLRSELSDFQRALTCAIFHRYKATLSPNQSLPRRRRQGGFLRGHVYRQDLFALSRSSQMLDQDCSEISEIEMLGKKYKGIRAKLADRKRQH